MRTLRSEIFAEMTRRGWTQKHLAQVSGVDESVVSKFLSNSLPRGATTNTVEKLLAALGWDGVKFKPEK